MIETVYHIPNAPGIAVLADLHGRPFEHIAQALRARMPELICIPGDFVFGLWPGENQSPLVTQENVLPFLRACAGIAPSILSLGNHEQYLDSADLNLIRSTGVTVLDNSWITRDGLVIGGLSSASVTACQRFRSRTEQAASGVRYPRMEHKQPTLPDTTWLTAFSATPGYHILLCHHPEYFPRIPESIELVLSGHAHGGQWRLYNPFKRQWIGVFAPGQGLWPRWTKGVHEGRLVVSAGLSNTVSVPRLFNPTEIVYIEKA